MAGFRGFNDFDGGRRGRGGGGRPDRGEDDTWRDPRPARRHPRPEADRAWETPGTPFKFGKGRGPLREMQQFDAMWEPRYNHMDLGGGMVASVQGPITGMPNRDDWGNYR